MWRDHYEKLLNSSTNSREKDDILEYFRSISSHGEKQSQLNNFIWTQIKKKNVNPRTPYATYMSRNLNRPCRLAHSPIRLNFSVYGIVEIPW